jgi:hypothetical protein
VTDSLKPKSGPCAVCGKPVKVGDGVWCGSPLRRVCQAELARPLEELAALLAKSK